ASSIGAFQHRTLYLHVDGVFALCEVDVAVGVQMRDPAKPAFLVVQRVPLADDRVAVELAVCLVVRPGAHRRPRGAHEHVGAVLRDGSHAAALVAVLATQIAYAHRRDSWSGW